MSVEWPESLFIDNAKLYAMVLEGMWKKGEDYATLLSVFLRKKKLKDCEVLDVPSGIGRIAVPLAKLGYSVTGVDLSPYFVSIARKKARQFSVARKASFEVGKMKEIGSMFPPGHFDVAINIFTSIGYGSDQDDLSFFKSVRKVVRDGGLFIIGGVANRDYLFSHFMTNLYDETDKILVIHKNELDVSHSRMKSNWRFFLKNGKALRFVAESPLDLRLYSPHELVGLLESTGWKVPTIYDSLTYRRPYSPDVGSMTLIAEAV